MLINREFITLPGLGLIEIEAMSRGVSSLKFVDEEQNECNTNELLYRCKEQLIEYIVGKRKEFDLPLDLSSGTEFQQKVWNKLLKIPYGETITYGDIARELGSISNSQAVGTANGQNPIMILVPCHRVIGADGSLTGYAGGIERKRTLLKLEGDIPPELF